MKRCVAESAGAAKKKADDYESTAAPNSPTSVLTLTFRIAVSSKTTITRIVFPLLQQFTTSISQPTSPHLSAARGLSEIEQSKDPKNCVRYLIGELDEFGGHCGRADDDHYHIAPVPWEQIIGKGLPIAYAFDGDPIEG